MDHHFYQKERRCNELLLSCLYRVCAHYILLFSITGASFSSATLKASKLLRRNLISGLVCQSAVRIVLVGLSLFVPSIVAVGMRIAGVAVEHSVIVAYVSLLVSLFGGAVIGGLADALFVCFVVDVDGDDVRFGHAHIVFSDLLQ